MADYQFYCFSTFGLVIKVPFSFLDNCHLFIVNLRGTPRLTFPICCSTEQLIYNLFIQRKNKFQYKKKVLWEIIHTSSCPPDWRMRL